MNNLFGGNRAPGIKPKKAVIRIERVADTPKPKPKPLASKGTVPKTPQHNKSFEAPIRASLKSSPARTKADDGSALRLQVKKRKAGRQLTPVQRLESDSEDDNTSSTGFEDISVKRQKSDRPIDLKRKLRLELSFTEDGGVFDMIHAADISAEEKKKKTAASPGTREEVITVELQYPLAFQRERYDLVFGKDLIDPAKEIVEIAKHVTSFYLTPVQANIFNEPNTGVIRKLTKAKNNLFDRKDQLIRERLPDFVDAVDLYNSMLSKLILSGDLATNLDSKHHLPLGMIETLLSQVYDRAVSPRVDILTKKHADAENEKDNTYGELLPKFVSMALEKAGLQSDQVFVDLGSGVGNVVLQAALEFGCESFGCEMVENACKLAEEQEKEFAARCRLWGINTGKVQLEQGNFFESQATHAAIKRADVILVNNEVFSADTNENLISLFLDCKDGCKIVSLQPFVEPGHEITERNLYDPRNQLDVERHQYHNEYVSWKYDGGDFFISKKDRTRIEAFKKHS